MSYQLQYQITEVLNDEVDAIPSVELYNADPQQMLGDALVRMSQPLEDGSPSPLSSRNILSAEAIILSNLLIQLQYFGHELNLFPDSLFLTFFRLFGLTRKRAVAPLVELEFTKSTATIESGETVYVKAGTQIRSKFFSDRLCTVIENAEAAANETVIQATGRIDQPGKLAIAVREGEFSLLPIALSSEFESVTNTQVISSGENEETVTDLITRGRTLLSRPGNRAVTARDYQEIALSDGGAETAVVLPRIAISDDNTTVSWSDLVTVAVYPETTVAQTLSVLTDLIPAGTRLDVVAGRVVPIDGTIEVGVDPTLTELEAFNLVATAIVDYVNPPNGVWGDRNFLANLSTVMEKVQGIYSVKPQILKHAETGVLLEDLTIEPHDLLEIQNSIEFIWLTN